MVAAVVLAASGALAQAPSFPGLAPSAPTTPPGELSVVPRATGTLALAATFGREGRPIRSGLTWRVFEENPADGSLKLVARSTSAAPSVSLATGAYVVHAAYGFASVTKRVQVTPG